MHSQVGLHANEKAMARTMQTIDMGPALQSGGVPAADLAAAAAVSSSRPSSLRRLAAACSGLPHICGGFRLSYQASMMSVDQILVRSCAESVCVCVCVSGHVWSVHFGAATFQHTFCGFAMFGCTCVCMCAGLKATEGL